MDAIQDTASKCQRINIPFTHMRPHLPLDDVCGTAIQYIAIQSERDNW